MEHSAYDAIRYLSYQNAKNKNDKNPAYTAFSKDIRGFQKSLETVMDFMNRRTVVDFLRHQAQLDDEVPKHVALASYRKLFDEIRKLCIHLDMFLYDARSTKGRPSLNEFYLYVYEVALLFEKLSEKEFSIDRHEDDFGKYNPVTLGHQFVFEATCHLNARAKGEGCDEQYTDKNVYKACEAARKKMNEELQSSPGKI